MAALPDVAVVEPLLVFPDPVPPPVAQALDLAGYPWKAAGSMQAAESVEPEDGWPGALVCADTEAEAAFAMCRALRKRELPLSPLLLLMRPDQLGELELREDLFDDFCVLPPRAGELECRLAHLFWKTGRGTRPDLVEYGPLVLNLETYQAALSGRPLDLTYMEYELLKFLATHPGRVHSRETLLSRVWGYEYYGGARTVDVHIRRLRAKLGEEHASLISTVRSVGYRFGQARWAG
jgi:two-component system alkaline phosphatase synthesis response regulator PhoP